MSGKSICKKILVILISLSIALAGVLTVSCSEKSSLEKNTAIEETISKETENITNETTNESAEISQQDSEETAREEETAKEEEIIEGEETIMEVLLIESPAFKNDGMIPKKYSCDGESISPPLSISGVPEEAKSLVLIMDDPDAPSKTWVHWTLWNIDPKTKEIPENSIPAGAVEGITDFGKPGYGGPCPPSGTHHYFFKIFALDIVLDLKSSATADDIMDTIENNIIESAELVGLYQSN